MTGPGSVEQILTALDRDRMYQAAELLLKSRREVKPIRHLPEDLRPRSLEEAYVLQDITAEAMRSIGGWKVGAPSPDATPLYGPMPLLGGFATSGSRIAPTFKRLRGVEAEIAFCLGKDLPPRAEPYSRDEVVDAIASAHPVIEMLESAYIDPDAVDRLSMIGDLQMHGGFAYGAPYADWKTCDLTRESVTVAIDGTVRFEGTASNPAGTNLLRLVAWLANHGSYRTGGLKSGQWITTGSWSGKTLANPGSTAEVSFSSFGPVSVKFDG
ncbi:MAG TPA: fumarylacetoacetate hydrolase family protein [Acidobacteriaceae bacterium]|nr:fumarylacetoacetate hydrolase family protein [Acidobacteriaceae bacterium]HTW48986.1 fumarylacetoacetate hydrolase family protein [Acidobacteriaceae bacterium]